MKLTGTKKPEIVEEKKPRPGKEAAKEVAKKTDWAKHSPERDNTHVPRRDFDALAERVATLERLLGNTSYIEVPGLVVTDDDDHPDQHHIDIDKSKCAGWTEPQMIAAGSAFGLDLTPYRGQPREIRRILYEEMAMHGIVLDKE